MKDKKHSIVSVDAEEAFEKIRHTFRIKIQVGYRRNISQHKKDHVCMANP